MSSNKEYLNFILEQLSELEDISYRAMMGEYIIYYKGRIVGEIYDNRLRAIEEGEYNGTKVIYFGVLSSPAVAAPLPKDKGVTATVYL